jgi:hypothetical protein
LEYTTIDLLTPAQISENQSIVAKKNNVQAEKETTIIGERIVANV